MMLTSKKTDKGDKSTIGNWSWGQEGDALPYSYQTFALDTVEENVKKYGGAYTMDLFCRRELERQLLQLRQREDLRHPAELR